jgi:flagellar M-ring protein FliF
MALGANASHAAARFGSLPIVQQVGLLVGLAVSIALGIWVVQWSQEPLYRPLFANLNSSDAAEVVDILQQNGYAYKIDRDNGSIMIDSSDIHDARMKLAQEGLPRGNGRGYEIFSNSNSFNTSQFMENARYMHAIETELSRTITRFNAVKVARVHLAVPRQSAFVRKKRKPKASVFLSIYPGMSVSKQTIASIANLVASSVPNLSSSDVTVVDQNGQLLNEGSGNTMMSMTDKFYDYRREVEKSYAQKVQDILNPILGEGRVRAKVSADIDFTSSQQTREIYNPDLPALRAEQTMTESRDIGSQGGGVVGATANQPAQEGELQTTAQAGGTNNALGEKDIRRQSIRNFELDKTISHTEQRPGRIERITVAVLVDNKQFFNEQSGKMETKPLTDDEMNKIRLLVSDSIGLNIKRGDSLNVVNVAFNKPEPIEPLPELPIYEQSWFWMVVKQGLGGIFVLFLVFGILRPMFNSLANTNKKLVAAAQEALTQQQEKDDRPLDTPEARLSAVKQFASNNPKGVAEVVKTWVDGG